MTMNQVKFNKIQKPAMDSVKWLGGFWGNRFDQCESLMLPSLEDALLNEANSAFMLNFARAAGRAEGGHIGSAWSDGDCYKWIQAGAHIYAVTKNEGIDQKMDAYIDDIAAAQEADGYINTFNQLKMKERWTWYRDHEIYNLGHLFTAGAVHYKATGKRNFLDIAIKAADYTNSVFAPHPKELRHFGFNPTNIMGLVDLYRVTEDEKYLKLAELFIEMRGTSETHRDDLNQNRTPFKEEKEAVGHAVLANYLYSGAVDVFSHTGDEGLIGAIDRVYDSSVNRKMYITGALGAYYHGMSSNLDPVEEAYGHDYELPSRVAYTETCANIGNAMFNYRLLNVTGDSRYADTMEQVMYNSGLSGANVEGTRFYYNNPLSRRDDGYISLGGTNITNNSASERWHIHQCYCCPTSYVRTVAQVHEWAYGESENSVWVHLYGASKFETQLTTGKISLTQKTDYPWDGRIEITVNDAPTSVTTIYVRIPRWCKNPSVTFNGEVQFIEAPMYLPISKKFVAGDKIVVDLPMVTRLMRGHYLVEETKGMVAVMRGPVVYCLEALDVDGDVRIDDLYLQRGVAFNPVYKKDLLQGVMTLETEAKYVKGEKNDDLYEALPEFAEDTVKISMIPYYAWSNRGCCDMSVWLPIV